MHSLPPPHPLCPPHPRACVNAASRMSAVRREKGLGKLASRGDRLWDPQRQVRSKRRASAHVCVQPRQGQEAGGLPAGGRAWGRDPEGTWRCSGGPGEAHLGGSTGKQEQGGWWGHVGPSKRWPVGKELREGEGAAEPGLGQGPGLPRGHGAPVRDPEKLGQQGWALGSQLSPLACQLCVLVVPVPRPHSACLLPVVRAQHAAHRADRGAPER